MVKLSDKIFSNPSANPFFTFEFFPPRTDQGFDNLTGRITRLSRLNPAAISVTWGAGGSTKDRSLELASLAQANGVDTILHLTCTNMEKGLVDEVLKTAKANGIQNILALRGDPPRGKEEWIPSDPRFSRAIDLVKYIRLEPEYSSWFCVGVAGYPDGHSESHADEDTELSWLEEKVDAGADFIVTQLFYDADHFIDWYKKVRTKGITVPVIPGIMPIQTFDSFARVSRLCGTRVPSVVADALSKISHDDRLVKDYGVELAISMVKKIIQETDIKGVQFGTLNLEKSVQRILEGLKWAGHALALPNQLIVDPPGTPRHPIPESEAGKLMISPHNASETATNALLPTINIDNEALLGEASTAATWDEFPNGRFGDSKSPAFGSQDLWGGPTIKVNANQWGNLQHIDDLTNLFLDYLHGEIQTTPFSPNALFPESLLVLTHLERLTKRGWWTVGSQPGADGVSSSHEIFGWGPRAGWVFQKTFVEFFCDAEDVDAIEKKIAQKGEGWVYYFAGNDKGECRTNVPDGGSNVATWGVFPGQEIVQTTIIDKDSFLSWKEEAFSIWKDWASLYRPGSTERELLDSIRANRWLVSVVHHDYKQPDALWSFLLDD